MQMKSCLSTYLLTNGDHVKEIAKLPDVSAIESVMIQGDLSKLTSDQRVSYYNRLCMSLGLNPLTKPFEYLKFQGREILYARRDCTDQLRSLKKVSIKIMSREMISDVYVVTAQATMPDGRCDESTGALMTKGLSGEAMANAMMKCETKAKRRVTLSICGLGLLDESEVETIREASPAKADEVNKLLATASAAVIEPEEPDFATEAAAAAPSTLKDYVIQIGKAHKGKKLSDLSKDNLFSFVDWVEANIKNKNPATVDFLKNARAYMEETE